MTRMTMMPGDLQPLDQKFPIAKTDGTPTDYFIRWAQQRQIDISGGITAQQALEIIEQYLADHVLQEGSGISLSPSGNISDSPTIAAEVQAILDQITNVQGSILFRGAVGWDELLPGTSGHFLKTNGAAANPEWAAGGGGGGGYTLITETISPGGTASITIGSIPNSYKSLRVELFGAGDTNPGALQLILNNDTSALYDMQRTFNGFGAGGGETLSTAGWTTVVSFGWSANSASISFLQFDLLNYADTSQFKQMAFHGKQTVAADGGSAYAILGGGQYRSTTAISQIEAKLQSGLWFSGATMRVYGL